MPNETVPVAGSVNQRAFQTSRYRMNKTPSDRNSAVAMEILQDERKRVLTAVTGSRLANGARGRVGPEGFVVGPAIVVARQPEQPGNRQDEQRRRKRQPRRPIRRWRTEPAVRRRRRRFLESRTARGTGRTCSDRPGMPPTSSRRGRSTSRGQRQRVGSTTRRDASSHQTDERSAGPVQSQ